MSQQPDPSHPGQSQRPDSPPGHEDDPGRGQEGAPGQQKPRPDNDVPDEGDDLEAQPK
jgi:hypothetical protein